MGEGGARGAALFGGCAAGLFTGPGSFPPPGDRAWVDDDEVSSLPTAAGEDQAGT